MWLAASTSPFPQHHDPAIAEALEWRCPARIAGMDAHDQRSIGRLSVRPARKCESSFADFVKAILSE
jgi:hypothetical protein